MNISDIPQTPRDAFNALTGKRPDLLMTPLKGIMGCGYMEGSKELGDYPKVVVVWAAPGLQPLIVLHSAN